MATITGNYSATTALTFIAAAYQDGYRYRAVFSNASGAAITTSAKLTIDPDD